MVWPFFITRKGTVIFVFIQQIDILQVYLVVSSTCICINIKLSMRWLSYYEHHWFVLIVLRYAPLYFCPLLSHSLFMFWTQDISHATSSFYSSTFFLIQWTKEKKIIYLLDQHLCMDESTVNLSYIEIRYCNILYVDIIYLSNIRIRLLVNVE